MLECIVAAGSFWLYGVGAWGGTFIVNTDSITRVYIGSQANVIIETNSGTNKSTVLSAESFTVGKVLEVIKSCDTKQ
jgi:hypothetical protein